MPGRICRWTALAVVAAAACTDVAPTAPSVKSIRPVLNVAADPAPARSFCNTAMIRIPAQPATSGPADIFPSEIAVSGIASTDYKVTVTINELTHSFTRDIDMLLVGPTGVPVMLMSDVGDADDNFMSTTLTFDDAATSFILPNPSTVIPSGTYKPTYIGDGDAIPGATPPEPYRAVLAAFDGTNANGPWQLYVWDDASGDTGLIAGGWCVNISSANSAPTAHAGGPYEAIEGSAISFDGSASSDPDNDIQSYQWDFGDGETTSGATPEHTYMDNGVYNVTLVVTDDDGATSTATTTVTVSNAAPVISAVTLPSEPVAVGTPVTITASFTDAGNDSHTAVFDLDNGTTATGQVSGGVATATVTYAQAGVYTITATVTDDDNGSDSRSSTGEVTSYIVVYDPSAGFVTGGGWITSPAGALVADPTASGTAAFGFVSAYSPGANKPSGTTQFYFQAGDLSFASADYAWLVVAGNKAKYKGEGTINAAGRYGFMLTAIDGGTDGKNDAFRIKIWDLGSGDVVYDNEIGADDDSDASTLLSGGSIVVHR